MREEAPLNNLAEPNARQYGYCYCGCGSPTPPGKSTDIKRGRVKGEPLHYLRGHQARKTHYIATPTGYASPCWVWLLRKDADGYGHWTAGNGSSTLAHRIYYERRYGIIPAGKHLDHLCRVRACVNPDHLEPVSPRENVRRSATTKLTPAAVKAIRASTEIQRITAARYGSPSPSTSWNNSTSRIARAYARPPPNPHQTARDRRGPPTRLPPPTTDSRDKR